MTVKLCQIPPSPFSLADMGNAQSDDSRQYLPSEQPALNTTRLLNEYLNKTDIVLHIGDITYARGYASVVRCILTISKNHLTIIVT